MTLKIRRAAVLGAGVMGAQIAAHLAAAGVRTFLLDLASAEPPADKNAAKLLGKNFRSARAIMAIENLKQLKPSPLMAAAVLQGIIPGNFDDDMAVLADCDWIIEAVIERLDIKQSINKKIAEYARPHVPVTTNTSGISLADIAGGLPEDYQKRFFGTHFFNPPRYMRLLEVIPHERTDKRLMADLCSWIEERLGKGIVHAFDTVNFIANRIGVFATQSTLKHMADLKLNIETVDNITGPLIGRAKSATLRTMDVVGLDTFAAVAKNTYERAPNDPYRPWFQMPEWVSELVKAGALGQKSNSVGMYKKDKDAKGQTVIKAYRPESKAYVDQAVQNFPWEADAAKERDTVKRLKLIFAQKDAGATLAWRAVRDVLSYASVLLEEIAGGLPKPIDDALCWGFNWEIGPFALWQALGYDEILERMQKEDVPLPKWAKKGLSFYAPGQQLNVVTGRMEKLPAPAYLHNLPQRESKDDKRVVLSNKSASLVDLGDGAACLVFHSKMNAIDFDITDMIMKSVAKVQTAFDTLVIGNDAPNFSAGANLKMIAEAIATNKFQDIDKLLREFQGALQLVKFAPFPTISCPAGLTLGGGCEVALHASHRVAAGETYAGLVEAGVGLVPAGGGTKELALRAYETAATGEKADALPFLTRAFLLIGMGKTSTAGQEAVDMGLFPPTTSVSLSKEHQIEKAKRLGLALAAQGYVPRTPAQAVKVAGDPGVQTFKMMLYNMVEGRQISPYDAVVGEKAAVILCGGEVDAGTLVGEQWFLDLERRTFLELCHEKKTFERIEYMLKNGKPLRN
jgi:3-hydroxyacyl-CoA dehydrogenase